MAERTALRPLGPARWVDKGAVGAGAGDRAPATVPGPRSYQRMRSSVKARSDELNLTGGFIRRLAQAVYRRLLALEGAGSGGRLHPAS
jgi:hypothetical protein